MKSAKLGVTAAELRASIEQAERDLLAETVKLGEALVVQQAMPDRDTRPEQDAAAAARDRIEKLRLMLPVVAAAEECALEEIRSQLDADRRKLLARAMKDLTKHSIAFSVHYQNAASAFRRMVKSAEDATGFLSDRQRAQGNGHFTIKLSASGLKGMAETEMNRVGLLPNFVAGVSAPGSDHRQVGPAFAACPQNLPSLEAEVRRLTALLLPAPEAEESANAPRLPQVAEIAKGHSAASAEAGSGHRNSEDT